MTKQKIIISIFLLFFAIILFTSIIKAKTDISQNIQFGGYTNSYESGSGLANENNNEPCLILISKYNLRFYNLDYYNFGGGNWDKHKYYNIAGAWIQYPLSSVNLNGEIRKSSKTGELVGYWFATIYRNDTMKYSDCVLWVQNLNYQNGLDVEAFIRYYFVYSNGNDFSFSFYYNLANQYGTSDVLSFADIGFMVRLSGNKSLVLHTTGGGTTHAYVYASSKISNAQINYNTNLTGDGVVNELFNTFFIKNDLFSSRYEITNMDSNYLEFTYYDTGKYNQSYSNVTLANRKIEIKYYEGGNYKTSKIYYSMVYAPVSKVDTIYGFTNNQLNQHIPFVTLSLTYPNNTIIKSTTSSNAGTYSFSMTNIVSGIYKIRANKTNYQNSEILINWSNNISMQYDIVLLESVLLGTQNNSLLITAYNQLNQTIPNVDITIKSNTLNCPLGYSYKPFEWIAPCGIGAIYQSYYYDIFQDLCICNSSAIGSYSENRYQTNAYGQLYLGNFTNGTYTIIANKTNHDSSSLIMDIVSDNNYIANIYLWNNSISASNVTIPIPSPTISSEIQTGFNLLSLLTSITGIWTILSFGIMVTIAFETKNAIASIGSLTIMMLLGFAIGAIPFEIFILIAFVIILAFASFLARKGTSGGE